MSYQRIINPELQLSQDRDYGAIQLLSNSFLSAVVKGEVDAKALLEYELAQRGYDADGNWIGLSEASNPVLAKYSI
jgi:hypothetical protein